MVHDLKIADLQELSPDEIAKWVHETRSPEILTRIEAEVVLAHKTRRLILDAIRPYAKAMGVVTAAHLLLDCALATGHKDDIGHDTEKDREF